MRALFWKFAFKLYGRRKPSWMIEAVLFVWGIFWTAVCGAALIKFPEPADALAIGWLVFGLALIVAGFAHRQIRKVREADGESALFFKQAKYNG